MVLVSRVMEALGVSHALKSFAGEFGPGFPYGTDLPLEQLINLRLLGGEAMGDTQLLNDHALCALFGWSKVAHPTTFGRPPSGIFLPIKSGSARDREPPKWLDSGGRSAPDHHRFPRGTAHGETMKGAQIGYNPHKPGRPSYHPLLAVDVKARSMVDGYLRPGNAGTGNGLLVRIPANLDSRSG